jgi:hypothetical protein
MAGDVLKQLLLRIQASEFYALQLDESRDVAGLAQLLVHVCYVYEASIKEGYCVQPSTSLGPSFLPSRTSIPGGVRGRP